MSICAARLPKVPAVNGRAGLSFEPPAAAVSRWNAGIRAAGEAEGDNVIAMLDVIGEDFWTGEGVTAKRVSAALRRIGGDVTVHINSPGGDYFEGLAIYNLLREHPHEVTVRVLGLAASAASVIAMAGDTIQIARAGFFMVHNTWALAMGNRHDMRAVADMLEPFDQASVDVYAARSGLPAAEVAGMLDRETWIGGSLAVEKGFADALLPSDALAEQSEASAALTDKVAAHRVDAHLARLGVPRAERRELIRNIKGGVPDAATGMPGAADAATRDAGASLRRELGDAVASLKSSLPIWSV